MSGATLLVVEDDFLIRLTLTEALGDAGFQVIEASSTDEALDLLRQSRPALLMTDIQLPGSMDGRELARVARQDQPDLPVIFMTGRPDVGEAAARSDRDRFIAKPYLPSEVCALVRDMIGP